MGSVHKPSPNCLLLQPRIPSPSFLDPRETARLFGAKHTAPPLGLLTVAALFPDHWNLRLVDCNVQTLSQETISWADIIFLGGHLTQQAILLELVRKFRSLNKTVVLGGLEPSQSPHLYRLANHLVLGEAEVTLPEFLSDYEKGNAKPCYFPNDRKADITHSPPPRFDLIDLDNYLYVGIQTSRGCPYTCDFCSVTTFLGHTPRRKRPKQILDELDMLYRLGYRGMVDIVDDNFIGDEVGAREFLQKLYFWMKQHNRPFEFATQLTINVANDNTLLMLLRDAGFSNLFIGIETPNKEILSSMKKRRNTLQPITESIHNIYEHGMLVTTSFILGNDEEPLHYAQTLTDCIEQISTPFSFLCLLRASPGTPLAERLKKEKRLPLGYEYFPESESCTSISGLNFQTLRPREDILHDFYQTIQYCFESRPFFNRVLGVVKRLNCAQNSRTVPPGRKFRHLLGLVRLFFSLLSYPKAFFLGAYVMFWCAFNNPKALRHVLSIVANYPHFLNYLQYVSKRLGKRELSMERPLNPIPVPSG